MNIQRWVLLLALAIPAAQSASQYSNEAARQHANQSDNQLDQLSRARTTDHDSEELLLKIFEPIASRAAGYGLIKFEEQSAQSTKGLVTFEGPTSNALQFEDQPLPQYLDQSSVDKGTDGDSNSHGQGIALQGADGGPQSPNKSGKKKRRRRRRRRKPRLQALGTQSYGFQGGYGFQNAASAPGVGPYIGPGPGPPQFHRPPSGALESVMAALAAVAQHDDLQCVPRLLCEALGGAANGATSGATSAVLRAVTTIQPLLAMLGSLSGSPLAVFGRAALLGAGGPDACRPAYPSCPADPQQLVHYLNNHNGGFFRFFNSPALSTPGQNYGLYNPGPSETGQIYGGYNPELHNPGQNYGIYKPNVSNLGQNYPALYSHPGAPTGNFPNTNSDLQYGYGYNYKGHRSEDLNKYIDKYNHNHFGYKGKDTKNSKIEKRILNRPIQDINDVDDSLANPGHDIISDDKKAKQFKFPEEHETHQIYGQSQVYPNKARRFLFPGSQSNRAVLTHVANTNAVPSQDEVQVVYVVRGDGDPYHPEVVRLRPGETLH